MDHRLNELYKKAIEQTKMKVSEDIERFLGEKSIAPSFNNYLDERIHYVEQIWVNVWLNMTNNDVPRKEKKRYLYEKDYVVDGVDKKLINKIFRNEMKLITPFDVFEWLNENYRGNEYAWQQLYSHARSQLLQKQKDEALAEKRSKVIRELEAMAKNKIDHNKELFYIHLRNEVASKFKKDVETKKKFSSVETHRIEEKLIEQGSFQFNEYTIMKSFFDELTGGVHKLVSWEYEIYQNRYEKHVRTFLDELITKAIFDEIPKQIAELYFELIGEQISKKTIKEMVSEQLFKLKLDLFSKISEEYAEDLLKLAEIPFSFEEHKKIYEFDLKERARRKAEELAEIERKKAEEKRVLEDIFGREYNPSAGRKIRYILHIGETNTGKTHHALEQMKRASTGLYLAPLRLLALEVYDKLNKEGINCGLKTGEEEKNVENASHLSCTVEMFYEKAFYDCIVIDEAQMIADRDRGFSWYKAITKANASEVHIIGSLNSKDMILQLLGDCDVEIHVYYREIPLVVEKKEFNIDQVKKGDALVCFSRKRVLETASKLENRRMKVSMIYGSMPPETRKKQIERFNNGEAKVIVATDAIGMGLNLPIRRIIFLENEKFDGVRRRRLTSQEVKQIAGRAGRKGIYDVGKVAFTKDIRVMKRLLEEDDKMIATFAIAPTTSIFERFQKYYRDLHKFFELWHKFESPKGTKKASLAEERELYSIIRDTEVEARLSMMDLYSFLHMPFSKKDPELIKQWRETMFAIIKRKEIPEPVVKRGSLEELELSYRAIGLYLMFLYRLNRGTEAIYWERVRDELSDDVHERLKTDVKKLTKKCRRCEKILPSNFSFQICDACHAARK